MRRDNIRLKAAFEIRMGILKIVINVVIPENHDSIIENDLRTYSWFRNNERSLTKEERLMIIFDESSFFSSLVSL